MTLVVRHAFPRFEVRWKEEKINAELGGNKIIARRANLSA